MVGIAYEIAGNLWSLMVNVTTVDLPLGCHEAHHQDFRTIEVYTFQVMYGWR